MTTENGTALAVRKPLTMPQIAQRIDVNVKSGWGLQDASREQLNGLALYCQRYDLLPGDEVTLYEGRPWKTLEGCVTLMRRNRDEYRGFSQRPLTVPEKEAWGWNADDIVIETTIRTATYGEIKGFGRVSAAERAGTYVKGVRHNPVAQHHAVEIAQKRSLQRTQKVAFGTENFVDDDEYEDAVRTVIQERDDPVRIQANAATYTRIAGDEEHSFYDLPSAAEAPVPAPRSHGDTVADSPSPEPAAVSTDLWMVADYKHPLWLEWKRAVKTAHQAQLEVPALDLPQPEEALRAAIASLLELVEDARTPQQAAL